MICARCGAAMAVDSRFCSRCGTPVVLRGAPDLAESQGRPAQQQAGGAGGVYPGYGVGYGIGNGVGYGAGYAGDPMVVGQVARRARTLGVLWCCFAGWRLLSGFVALVFFRTFVDGHGRFGQWMFAGGPEVPWMAGLMPVMVVGLVLSSALALVAGWALLTRQSWGRVLAITAAILSLVKFPLGTVLGVYTLTVLLRRGAGEAWERVTAGAEAVRP